MGARGHQITKLITADEILQFTNGGWDVFCKELGKFPVSRAFRHPLKKDTSPSGSIVNRGGIWFLCDFANTFPTMTAIQFVQHKYSLTFREAIDKICWELGIKQQTREYVPIEVFRAPPKYVASDVHIGFSEKKWGKEQYQYWEGTGVDKRHCNKYNTFAVQDASINRKRIRIGKDEVVWAYYADDIDKVKLYFPEREKKDRFKTNVPGNYLWNIKNIGGCDKILVQKSNKDMLCTLVLFECVIATMSENAAIFTDEIVEKIHGLAETVYIAYGSDRQGVAESTKLSEKYKWKWVNPDKRLLPDVNDAYSLIKAKGIEAWEKQLRNKKII